MSAKREPVVIDADSGRVTPVKPAAPAPPRRPILTLRRAPPPPAPSIGAVLDGIAREAIEDMARDAARELRRAVRRAMR